MSGQEPNLDAIRARADAATPGPWKCGSGSALLTILAKVGGYHRAVAQVPFEKPQADAEFIAHARSDIPALLAALTQQQAVADRRLDANRILTGRLSAFREQAQIAHDALVYQANGVSEESPCVACAAVTFESHREGVCWLADALDALLVAGAKEGGYE